MPLSFQTEILPRHVQAATVGIFWRQAAQPLVLGALGLFWFGAHLTLVAIVPTMGWSFHAALALLFLFSVLGVAQVASRHYQTLAQENFKRFEGAPVSVRLESEAYVFEAAWGQGAIPWTQFQSLWRLKDVWVLLQHSQGGASVLLPVETLDEEARNFILERLADVKAKVMA